MKLLDEGLNGRERWATRCYILERYYDVRAACERMERGHHQHPRHPMSGCHTNTIRERRATFSLSVDYKTRFGVLSGFERT